MNNWTTEEKEYLKKNYSKGNIDNICTKLSRNENSIRGKARKLNLTREREVIKRSGHVTKDGSIKYQSIKSLFTVVNELWLKVNALAKECGLPDDSFLVIPDGAMERKLRRRIFTPHDIVLKVTSEFGSIKGKGKTKNEVRPKFVCCHLLKKYTQLTLREIANEVYGKSDHSCVLNALKKTVNYMETDSDFKYRVETLEKKLEKEVISINANQNDYT